VFWHALGSIVCAAHAAELAPALTARGWRLVAPDGPGFGGSPALPAGRYQVPALARLLWELVGALRLERPVLAGHSWGGVVACAAAARPEWCAGLILLDSGHMDYQDTPSFVTGKTLAEYVAQAEDRAFSSDGWDAFWAELQEDVRRPLTPELKEIIRACVREEDGRIVPSGSPEAHGAAYHGIAVFRATST
jgi:pimeloyl-ACP methyl ester carboxylesterase